MRIRDKVFVVTGGGSGIGREGPRYAIRDMTEERLVLFNL